MCKNCDIVNSSFKKAVSNPHGNFIPVYNFLSVLVAKKQLEIYAGDCPFEEMLTILDEEKHYTVCFYLRCPKCKRIYFFGACIRGTPVYKRIENIKQEKIDNLILGKEGIYFQ